MREANGWPKHKEGLDQPCDPGLGTKLGLVFLFALDLDKKCQSNEKIQKYVSFLHNFFPFIPQDRNL